MPRRNAASPCKPALISSAPRHGSRGGHSVFIAGMAPRCDWQGDLKVPHTGVEYWSAVWLSTVGSAHAPCVTHPCSGCAMPVEVNRMGARLRLVVPAWMGLVLVVMGVLVFVASYFLLPVMAEDVLAAGGALSPTTCQFSLHFLSAWVQELRELPHIDSSLVPDTVLLVLYYLPLLAAVAVVGWSFGFLVRPHRALAMWGYWAWLTGSMALAPMLFLVLFGAVYLGGGPHSGLLGLLVGYGVLWAGNRIFLTAHP